MLRCRDTKTVELPQPPDATLVFLVMSSVNLIDLE